MTHSDNDYDYNQTEMTEGTNMMVEMLANSDKLINKDERWYYTKKNNHDDYDNDDVDDDFDSYKRSDNAHKSETNNHSENNSARYDDKYSDNKDYSRDDRDDRDNRDKSDYKDKPTDKYIDDEYENLSPLEKRLRRLDFMRKLGELRDLGCKVTNYSIDDDYYMMKYEYELHTSIRTKRNWMGLYNHMLIGGVKLLELGNDRYNPFDFSLKGLSNEVSADKTTYYEILGEIFEHYNVPGKKMNPWFRLAINLIGTVAVVGGKNNVHKFLPKQAAGVENDESMLENLRSRAMNNNSQPAQAQPVNNNLDEFMNKEHDKAAQRVKDLEDLKRQELEFQQYQKMLAEDNSKFVNIKKQLEMSQQSPMSAISSKSRSVASKPVSRSQSQSKSKSLSRSRKEESTESSSNRSTLSNQTTESDMSTVSTVSVNKKLAAQFRKNNQPIKASSISFGSSNKGKKSAISIGGK
jgi:hypothetical protein